jgi:hypothetical protein
MIAPLDLHSSHGGVPSHVSRSPLLLHSFVQPIHEVEVGICSLTGSMPVWCDNDRLLRASDVYLRYMFSG